MASRKIDNLNAIWQKEHPNLYTPPFGYFSLKPAWAKNVVTKYKVMYWLNPRNQEENHADWVTVESLELWLKGQGPIKKGVKNV